MFVGNMGIRQAGEFFHQRECHVAGSGEMMQEIVYKSLYHVSWETLKTCLGGQPCVELLLSSCCIALLCVIILRFLMKIFDFLTLFCFDTHTLEFIFIRERTHSLSFTLIAFLYIHTYMSEFFISFCLHGYFTLISELIPILTLQYQQKVFFTKMRNYLKRMNCVSSDEMKVKSEFVITSIVETHFLEIRQLLCEYEQIINIWDLMVMDFHFFRCFRFRRSMMRELERFFHGFCVFIICYCLSADSVYVHSRCVIDVRMLLGRNIRLQYLNVADVIRQKRSSQIFEWGTNLIFSVLSEVCVIDSIDDPFIYSLCNLA